MQEAAERSGDGLGAEEARLARAAAAGDADAFATLYERYAGRAYNLAVRLSGSDDDAADAVQEAFLNVMRRLPELGDRELAFGSYLFTATRNATYDLMRRQQRSRPSDSIPESAVPVGAGAGGMGLDPGDPEEDPDRGALLASQREEIREANARLPERQREALALRELEEMSYDEIATVMEMNRNSVAQLISRARINLRDELRQTTLASIAAASVECERALPLIAMREDGQLGPGSEDAAWLDAHLAGCETCGLATEAMQEAGASYRLWVPAAVAPWLFRETMARAAELAGADWSGVIEHRLASPADPATLPGMPPAYRGAPERAGGWRRRRRAAAAAAALALLLGGGAAVVVAGGGEPDPAPAEPAAAAPEPAPAAAPATTATEKQEKPKKKKAKPEPKPAAAAEPAPPEPVSEAAAAPAPTTTAAEEPDSPDSNARGGGGGGLETKEPVTREPKPEPKPEPEPTPEPPPPPTTPPPTTPPADPPNEPIPPRDPNSPFGGPGNIQGNGGGT